MRSFAPVALVCVALIAPPAAAAQSSDPEPGSPSGSIYQIPLEGGRDDAAPGGRARRAGGGDQASSPIHSSNGFGSSSTVPGTGAPAPAGATTSSGGGQREGAVAAPAPAAPGAPEQRDDEAASTSEPGARNGQGAGERREPGESDIAAGKPAPVVSQAAARTSSSVPRALLILGLGLTVAAGLAAAARLANRRR